MNSDITVALLSLLGVIISVIVTSRSTANKLMNELTTHNKLQDQKIEQIGTDIKTTTKELNDKIDVQNEIINLKIEHITSEQASIKKDIESHNSYAKMFQESVPVLTEKISVANKRIADLEQDIRELRSK